MEIYFPDAERRHLFCNGNKLRGRFGDALAEMICSRLQLLKKVESLAVVPPAPPIALSDEPKAPGTFSVALGETHRLFFEAVDEQLIATGTTHRKSVLAIRVLAVTSSSSGKESIG